MNLLTQITPEKKDEVLTHIITNYKEPFSFGNASGQMLFNIDEVALTMILDQFHDMGLTRQTKTSSGVILYLTSSAIDFHGKGGFVWQEALLLQSVDKLILEIDVLRKELGPKHLETASKLATIAGTFSAYLAFLKN